MLVERGDEVRALVRPVEDSNHLKTLKGVEIVAGDLTDEASLKRAVQGVQRVYNVGAKTGPWGLEEVYHAVNGQGLASLGNAARDGGGQRIVHTRWVTGVGLAWQGRGTRERGSTMKINDYGRP